MKDRFRGKWENLSVPKKRRLVTGVFIVFVVLFLTFAYQLKESRHRKAKRSTEAPYKLSQVDMVKETWFEKSSREIDELKRQLREAQKRQDALQKELQSIKKQKGLIPGLDMGGEGTPVISAKDLYPPPAPSPPEIARAKEKGFNIEPIKPNSGSRFPPPPPPSFTGAKKSLFRKSGKGAITTNLIGVIEDNSRVSKQGQEKNAPSRSRSSAVKEKTPGLSFYIPTGSFSTGMLLTGLDAPTGVKAKKSPHPTLIRLQDLSFLPNELRENFTGCLVLGEGYGDLSAERAYIRLLNLSCADVKTRMAMDMKIKGYVVDTDGRIGLRGKVVTKQGAFLARALTAAFLDGIAEAFKTTSTSISVTPEGTVKTVDIDNLGEGLKVGVGEGFGRAASKLSDFYMDLAKETFPVIEVGAKRHVTLVLTEGIKATFDKSLVIAKKIKEEL